MAFTREELAYVAGLFEGEGTVYTVTGGRYKTKTSEGIRKTPRIQLAISMTDYSPLEQVVDCLGFGKIYGPYWNSSGPRNYPSYHLRYHSFEKVQAIIAAIWEWLSPRRQEQCVEALRTYHAL